MGGNEPVVLPAEMSFLTAPFSARAEGQTTPGCQIYD
ncbi:hypothetical protein BN439_1846 [Erwinia amylovora Ea644]|nr:hypothetical protein BN439_1846 [Erwinia amylovora Ea644]